MGIWFTDLPEDKKRREVRKIKSHVKGVVVLGLNEKGERIVLGAFLDKAYSPRGTYFCNG